MDADRATLETAFPNLRHTSYEIASSPARTYNCIAWAAGDVGRWWWPTQMAPYYWPVGVPREVRLESFVRAFQTLGYEVYATGELEPEFEKVALYARNGVPTHAARQLESGVWTSKLGTAHDIQHAVLAAVEGSQYGSVAQIMRRPRHASTTGAARGCNPIAWLRRPSTRA